MQSKFDRFRISILKWCVPNTEQIRPMFLPGGILSPDQKVGYFVNINNGIDAIDLNDGSVLWTTDVASYPLLATNKWLVVHKRLPPHWNIGGAFTIATLALDNGSLIFQSATIFRVPFYPPSYCWGKTNLNFQLRATTNRLFLDWQAQDSSWNRGTIPLRDPSDPSPQRKARDKARGKVRINLNSGVVERLPLEAPITDTSVEEPLPSGCWTAGQKIVDLVRDEIGGQQGLQLRIRDRYGERNIEKIIELGRGETLHYIVTLDQCYIFVCPDICDVGQPWWIFAAETGELLTTVNYDASYKSIDIRSIAIFNSKIYYLVDQRIDYLTHQSVLKVKDLNSGKLCWEYLVEPPKTERPRPC
jgi:hypothetical protein